MSRRTVQRYKLAWNTDDGRGYIEVLTDNGPLPQMELPAQAFTALAIILQHEAPVYYDTDRKIFYTGPEEVND